MCLHNQENIPALLLGSTLFGVGGNGLLGSSGVIRIEDQRDGVRQGSRFPTEMCKLGAPAVLFAHGGSGPAQFFLTQNSVCPLIKILQVVV